MKRVITPRLDPLRQRASRSYSPRKVWLCPSWATRNRCGSRLPFVARRAVRTVSASGAAHLAPVNSPPTCCSCRKLRASARTTNWSSFPSASDTSAGNIAAYQGRYVALETHFRSPQLDLWQLSETEWLLALRRPEPAARKKLGNIVPLARQLPLPEFGAAG